MKGFALANSPEDALQQLASEGFSEAIITGGATINSEFAKRGLIDEIILDINPSIVGQGLPIFAPQDFQLQLELLNVEKIGKELIEIRYRVVKAES